MNLDCPNCHHKAVATDINFQTGIINCFACQHEFHVEGHDIDPNNLTHKEAALPPKNLKINRHTDRLELIYAHNRPQGIISISLTIFVPALIVGTICFQILTNHQKHGFVPLLLFSGIGIIALGWAFLKFINKTHININGKIIKITRRPFKFFSKDKVIRVSNIEQLFVRQYIETSEDDDGKKRSSTYYALDLKSINNRENVNLLKGFTSFSDAIFFEKEIESYLGIEDKLAVGEFHPNHTLNATGSLAFSLFSNFINSFKKG